MGVFTSIRNAFRPPVHGTAPRPQPDGSAPASGGHVSGRPGDLEVVLVDVGAEKIPVIVALRELRTMGLKEAKNLVDRAPAVVLENVDRETAEAAKAKFEAAGATIDIR